MQHDDKYIQSPLDILMEMIPAIIEEEAARYMEELALLEKRQGEVDEQV